VVRAGGLRLAQDLPCLLREQSPGPSPATRPGLPFAVSQQDLPMHRPRIDIEHRTDHL